ncbi:MAG TPA: alpha/beta family hydrolase, partial [Streptosporangiaceae bacterium]|nr:alpha/beta family hydrolase [Streptosporangiaceae bacterium]
MDLAGLSGRGALLLVLTHGAGGGAGAPDLLAAREAGLRAGAVVALVTQPYRKRGARAPGSAARQDEAWLEIIAWLRANVNGTAPLIQGGRSNGARVACRTAKQAGARGVIALAFPLRPPGRRPPVPAAPGAPARAGRTAPGRAGQGHSEPERTGRARAEGAGRARAEGAGQERAGQTRAGELREAVRAGANVLVVSGDRDLFG